MLTEYGDRSVIRPNALTKDKRTYEYTKLVLESESSRAQRQTYTLSMIARGTLRVNLAGSTTRRTGQAALLSSAVQHPRSSLLSFLGPLGMRLITGTLSDVLENP